MLTLQQSRRFVDYDMQNNPVEYQGLCRDPGQGCYFWFPARQDRHLVVLAVLKHLHRHNSVKFLLDVKVHHIRSDDRLHITLEPFWEKTLESSAFGKGQKNRLSAFCRGAYICKPTRLVSLRSLACSSIKAFWVAEFDTAVTLLLGYLAATYKHMDPQPHPSSRISCPSASSAR